MDYGTKIDKVYEVGVKMTVHESQSVFYLAQ